MASPNPFNPYFLRCDELVPKLDAGSLTDAERAELGDLMRRALFYIAAQLNQQVQGSQALMLPEPDTDDADTPSLDQPQDTVSEDHVTT